MTRTRFLDSLTNAEVAEYLKRNDLIFLPVGTVEMHGEMPLGCEHVLPLAFAAHMAEEADGLVLPNLAYFFPGATAIGAGTVCVPPSTGIAYLKEIFRSLHRQGFRRQVALTAHGPASVTLAPAVREFFEESRCTVLYLDLCSQFNAYNQKNPEGADFNKMIWGAYKFLGRLDEVPLNPQPLKRAPHPEPLAKLKGTYGYYFSDASHHGWWPEKPMTAEDRIRRAEEGVTQLRSVVQFMNPKAIAENLREVQRYHEKEVFKKFGDRLR